MFSTIFHRKAIVVLALAAALAAAIPVAGAYGAPGGGRIVPMPGGGCPGC